MKYGETLPQLSVFEWLPFNLDYNEICKLIKKHTLGRIPVSNPNLGTDFDDELFDVLMEQLDRIELFVKSKAREIDRRIEQCHKVVITLCQRDTSNNLSSKRLMRYVKAEADLEHTLNDIQHLSRFANAQYTGFKKLLKKYKRWTGSTCVVDRFEPKLESPDAFHNREFEQKVLVLSELLAAVRLKYNESIEASHGRKCSRKQVAPPLITETISSFICREGGLETRADIDMALGTNSPSNPSFTSGRGGKAIYWVHNDHLVEVQVLLLKHMNIQSSTPVSSVPPTPTLSRRSSTIGSSSLTWASEKVEDVGTIILDNLPKFAQAQSSKTIEQASTAGPAARIRWCGVGKDAEASVMVNSSLEGIDQGDGENGYFTTRLKRKHIESLINTGVPLTMKEQNENTERIRGWFQGHPDIAPLVKILARRTRFVSGGKVWAVLDRGVRIFRLGENWEGWISDPRREEEGPCTVFPHAVLEIRWEGLVEPDVARELDKSHLVEPVPGFSLDVHAVAVTHEPKEMAPPFWLPALSKDIRKTPPRPLKHNRQPSANTIHQASSGPSISSTAVVDFTDASLESSGTLVTPPGEYTDCNSTLKKKKTITWGKPSDTIEETWLGGERYWSEFNDENDDEPFTILIHPQSAETETSGYLGKFSEGLKRFFNFDDGEHPNERTPLILGHPPAVSDEEVCGNSAWRLTATWVQQEQARERNLFRRYCFFFVVSILILSAAGMWALTHSPRKRDGPDMRSSITETVAVLAAAVLAGYAVSLFITRQERVSMLHKSVVLGLFCLICLVGSLILSIVYNNWLRP